MLYENNVLTIDLSLMHMEIKTSNSKLFNYNFLSIFSFSHMSSSIIKDRRRKMMYVSALRLVENTRPAAAT